MCYHVLPSITGSITLVITILSLLSSVFTCYHGTIGELCFMMMIYTDSSNRQSIHLNYLKGIKVVKGYFVLYSDQLVCSVLSTNEVPQRYLLSY